MANGTSPDEHRERLGLLIEDCNDLDPRLLRIAAKRAAKEISFLPTAAELHRLVEEAAQQPQSTSTGSWLESRIRQFNLDNKASGSAVRGVVKGERVETFKVGDRGEHRIDGPDGTIINPWFCHDRREWIYGHGENV